MFLIGTSDETTYGQPPVCRCASQKISISPSSQFLKEKGYFSPFLHCSAKAGFEIRAHNTLNTFCDQSRISNGIAGAKLWPRLGLWFPSSTTEEDFDSLSMRSGESLKAHIKTYCHQQVKLPQY